MSKAEIRRAVIDLSVEVSAIAAKLKALHIQLHSRAPVRRAPASSMRMTAQIRRGIIQWIAANPTRTYSDCARHFGVNAGRVSEVIAGHRSVGERTKPT